MAKTLVTGAGGFIGSAVVRVLHQAGRQLRCLLAPHEEPTAIAGMDVEIVRCDIRDRNAVARAVRGCNVVYHLAALYKLWLPKPEVIYDINVGGTRNVLLAAVAADVERMVHTSSIAAVGHRSGELSDESFEFNMWREANDYIRSKWLGECEALSFAAAGLPVIVVNPSFPFGVGDRAPTPTGQTLLDVLDGKIPGYTSGGLNVVDVDDCAAAHVLAEQKGRVGERYILGSHNISYRDFLAEVAAVIGRRLPLVPLPSRALRGVAWAMERYAESSGGEPALTRQAVTYASRRLWFDTTKATQELGMTHRPLRDTIDEAVSWYRQHGYTNR